MIEDLGDRSYKKGCRDLLRKGVARGRSIDITRLSCTLLRTGLLQAAWNWDGAEIALENPALEHPIDTTVIRAPVHNTSFS